LLKITCHKSNQEDNTNPEAEILFSIIYSRPTKFNVHIAAKKIAGAQGCEINGTGTWQYKPIHALCHCIKFSHWLFLIHV